MTILSCDGHVQGYPMGTCSWNVLKDGGFCCASFSPIKSKQWNVSLVAGGGGEALSDSESVQKIKTV